MKIEINLDDVWVDDDSLANYIRGIIMDEVGKAVRREAKSVVAKLDMTKIARKAEEAANKAIEEMVKK